MTTQKIAPTRDQRAYEEWIERVLKPFSAQQARRDVSALFDDEHEQRLRQLKLLDAESDSARLLRQLLKMRTFAEAQCAKTVQQRVSVVRGGQRAALPQLEQDIQRLYKFLSHYNRAQRYNIDLSRLSLNTFLNAKKTAAFCEKLAKGVQSEIRHALHRRLEMFLETMPIGGKTARQFDVAPLLRFALEKRLEHVDNKQLYALFVEEKTREMRRALAEQGIDVPDDDLAEEQFELMRGAPAAAKPILTENNQVCTGPCMPIRNSKRKMCVTAPYRKYKYGVRYTWDYCD